ncbi:MAG: hypothetical protein D6815_05125 [Candidatus Dadabacteria bacterium]|nr:MAG: hypothetical protein D6815_05125 [Candidatus Dadabacteria bacterium]
MALGSSIGRAWRPAAAANLLRLGVLAYMAVLHRYAPDFYYLSVQEDEYIEWATYCAFAFAAAGWLAGAWRHRIQRQPHWWFALAMTAFCVFVAGEEISWGQRLLAYRPPVYFLEHNFQQELNVHNVISTDLRKLGLKCVLAGYGIALPLIAAVGPIRRRLDRWGVVAPPAWLIPLFAAALAAYVHYPWKYTGEIVELMMGLGFLFAVAYHLLSTGGPSRWNHHPAMALAACWLAAVVFGGVNAWAGRVRRAGDPARIAAARVELEALRKDFQWMARHHEGFSMSHSLHKRVYTYEVEHKATHLREGEFAALRKRGLNEARAEFFLDPWNLPYWINVRSGRSGEPRMAFVYSFGPNRRRDSTYTEIRGDDLGAMIVPPHERD